MISSFVRLKDFKMSIARSFLQFACFATTFGMTLLWICRYTYDKDIVQLDIKRFDFLEGRYPMLSFCLVDKFAFNESKFEKFNGKFTREKYLDFLKGNGTYEEAKNVSFEDVSYDLADFYLGDLIRYRNGSETEGTLSIPKVTYSGSIGRPFIKCFGLNSQIANLEFALFSFNTSMFPNGVRPSKRGALFVYFHLPNQLVLAGSYGKFTWPKRNTTKEYVMYFKMQQVEILRRRNKRNDPCLPDTKSYDQMIFDDRANGVGCKAPFQNTTKSLPFCKSAEEMKKAFVDIMAQDKQIKACTSLADITFTYDEFGFEHEDDDWFHVAITYPHQYKEIVMVRAVDIETVIANISGYIGLFLGKNSSIKRSDNNNQDQNNIVSTYL